MRISGQIQQNTQLNSLEEIEAYIAKNKHLPELPNVKQVEVNGIELGEMNKLLLKKIEELTLYLIDQHKAIIKLRQDMPALKK